MHMPHTCFTSIFHKRPLLSALPEVRHTQVTAPENVVHEDRIRQVQNGSSIAITDMPLKTRIVPYPLTKIGESKQPEVRLEDLKYVPFPTVRILNYAISSIQTIYH